VRIDLELDVGELMPAILDLPLNTERCPGVVLLHGLGSNKEQIVDSVGRSLTVRGVASFALDIPVRVGEARGLASLATRNPITLVEEWCLAVRGIHHAVKFLANHDAIDPTRIGIAGYSLGAYLAVAAAAENSAIRAIALASGGDLPHETPFRSVIRAFCDPRRAVRELSGRPLLMVNGRFDQYVRPELAIALYEAANHPKEIRWYDGEHWPPSSAIDGTAEWLTQSLQGLTHPRPARRAGWRRLRTMVPNRF
jgi:dienelactone hydrolase